MLEINLGIIFLYILLAVASIKNYSKYRTRGLGNKLIGLHKSMSETLLGLFKIKDSKEDVKENLRKINVVSHRTLEELALEHRVNSVAAGLVLFSGFNVLSALIGVRELVTPQKTENIIERNDYGGKEETCELFLVLDGESYEYSLNIAPMEYTQEEFYLKGEEVFDQIRDYILGDNPDFQHISSDLNLFPEEILECFDIEWDSSHPMLIDEEGHVFSDNIIRKETVTLRANLFYGEYCLSKEYSFVMQPVNDTKKNLSKAFQTLENMEANSRNQKFIEIPDDLHGVKIELKTNKEYAELKVLFLGVAVSFLIVMLQKEKLMSKGKERDNMLSGLYPSFVNKLWLLLGAGMTIKKALFQIVSEAEEKGILQREIEYSLNQIDTGLDEGLAYEELGRRINIPMYTRLMNQISHHLKRGGNDLLKYMEEEVKTSYNVRKEFARRLGEEASTKLLFPMIVLMAIVMVIVIVPAVTGF